MRVAVLGAGLQGSCVALALAGAGVRVDLVDRAERPMSRTSARNEGKVHLGYVYANDPGLETARTMVRGALSFAPLLRRWLGGGLDAVAVSRPFDYVVHRDSLLGPDAVAAHLRAVHALLVEAGAARGADYLGADPREPPEPLPAAEWEARYDPRSVTAAFRTGEVAIDAEDLARLVRRRLEEEPLVRCLTGVHVEGVEPRGDRVAVTCAGGAPPSGERYDHVVNALWDGRLAVDRTAGLAPPRPWLYRVRYNLRVHAPADGLPSTTIVLGGFGDVASYGGRGVFLTWYPVGMRGRSRALSPPAWPLHLDGEEADRLRRGVVDGLAGVVPAVAALGDEAIERSSVVAGVVVAWGETDIHDPASRLHRRHEIGPLSRGRYHTVDTGKLTTAPLFAQAVAERILAA